MAGTTVMKVCSAGNILKRTDISLRPEEELFWKCYRFSHLYGEIDEMSISNVCKVSLYMYIHAGSNYLLTGV